MYPVDFQKVIPYLVASAVHHSSWLLENLRDNHPLFASRFWRGAFQEILKTSILVPSLMHCDDTGMVATGIPPMQAFMFEQSVHNAGQIAHNATVIEALKDNRAFAQTEILIKKIQNLEDVIKERVDIVPSISESTVLSDSTVSTTISVSSSILPQSGERTVYYNNVNHTYTRVPENYKFIWKVTLRTIHDLFNEGDPSHLVIPYKHLDPKDLIPTDRKALSKAKYVVKEIDRYLPDGYVNFSADAKDASFASAFDIMACAFVADNPEVTKKVTEAMAFTTIYNKYYGPCMKKRKVLEGIEVAPNL